MGEEQFETLLRFFKALGNESRLKIVGILANGEHSVGELATLLELKEPTVSHHLAKLRELGLVSMRPERNTHYYRLNSDSLESMSKEVFSTERIASLADEVDWEAWERKVLQDYFDGDQLRQIPSKQKKRLVVLRWLAERFEMDTRYSEKEINEIIERHYPEDHVTLRRYLIDYQFMARERGIYWRLAE